MVDRKLVGYHPCAIRPYDGIQVKEEDLLGERLKYTNQLGGTLYDAWQRIMECNQDYGGCPQQCPVRKLIFKLQKFLPDRT